MGQQEGDNSHLNPECANESETPVAPGLQQVEDNSPMNPECANESETPVAPGLQQEGDNSHLNPESANERGTSSRPSLRAIFKNMCAKSPKSCSPTRTGLRKDRGDM